MNLILEIICGIYFLNPITDKSSNNKVSNKIGNLNSCLNCWYRNVTSLNNKFDSCCCELVVNNIDVAFVCEIWWSETSLFGI